MEGLLLKQVASQELFAELAALVENSTNRSPVPVRCTRKLFTNLTNHVDTVSVQSVCLQAVTSYKNSSVQWVMLYYWFHRGHEVV